MPKLLAMGGTKLGNLTDLRAGAALALCGLIADGETVITDAWQIGRGYVDFVGKMRNLGACIHGEFVE